MPIYTYQAVEAGCERCRVRFEHMQRISEPPLEACPHCGCRVRKMVSLPARHIDGTILGGSNIAQQGFTKYVKKGSGHYEKVAGSAEAPDTLDRGMMANQTNVGD